MNGIRNGRRRSVLRSVSQIREHASLRRVLFFVFYSLGIFLFGCAGGGGGTQVTPAPALAISSLGVNPASVIGGTSATATVSLNGFAPTGGALVSVSSNSSPTAASPSAVMIPAGSSTATFTVATSAVNEATQVMLSASYNGVQTAVLTVMPPAIALSSVTVNPIFVVGGATSTGAVTLNSTAPAGGAVVTLTSGNTSAATVPASVMVAAGATTAAFTVTTSTVVATAQVTLTGTYNGSQTASIMVNPPVISSVSVTPTSVTGGTGSTGTVTLSGAAPAGGAVVALASGNSSVASFPAGVTVAAGASSATFPVTTFSVGTATQVTLTGTYNGSQNTLLTVNPPVISSVSVNPTSLTGGTGSTGTVTLNAAAPSSGAVVTLTSSNTAAATVPMRAMVTAGATSATFPVTTSPVGTATQVTLTGTYNGTQNTTLTINAASVASLSMNPASVAGGAISTGTVTLNGPSPSGGASVALVSSDTSVVPVPSSVLISPGANSATFQVTTAVSGTAAQVSFTATYNGSQSATLTVNSPATVISSLNLNPNSVTGGTGSAGTVTLSAAAPAGGAMVTLASSNTAAATVPTSVTVTAGANSATFPVTTSVVGTATQVTLTGTYIGTQIASLTVNPPVISSVSVNPTSVTGGAGSTGTVTLSAVAPAGGAVVTLTSGNPSAATVPTSVTVAAGATSATFPVTTSAVGTAIQVTLTVTYNGSQNTSLSVKPPVISSVSVNPTSVTGGTGSTGTVTLNAVAPSNGAVVALASGNPSVATVPASVTVTAGATTAAFTVTTAAVTSTSQITLTATYGASQANTSISVLGGLPVIVTQPSDIIVNIGQTATFAVVATGAAPLTYQWQKNGSNIPEAQSSSYITPATAAADDGSTFDVVVTNGNGSVTSSGANLSVISTPRIETQPANQSVMVGESATFSVYAIGSSNLTYQWLQNGAIITGATNSSYTTPPTVMADSGEQFSVTVTDSLGSGASSAAILTVVAQESPATYYIDFANGADTNNGISKSTPWQYAPGMANCTANCAAINLQPADSVIFRGGTTWDTTGFPMTVSWSGTAENPIYFGVDPTWFAGTVWTRPVFDLSGGISMTAPILASSVSYVTFDNLEIANEIVDSINASPPRGSITIFGGSNVTVENCYFHGWSIMEPAAGSDANPFGGVAFYNNSQQGLVQNCIFDGSPASNSGTGIYDGATLQGNIIENVPNGIKVPDQVPNLVVNRNQISNVTNSIDPSATENAIFVSSGGSVYDNIVHDLASSATGIYFQPPFAQTGTTQYIYDNLVWNTGTNPAVTLGPGYGTSATYFIYNNTLVSGPGSCIGVSPNPLVALSLTVENNHCVSDQTSAPAWCWNGARNNSNCGSAPSLTFVENVLMTTPAALSQGYTIQNSFQPTSSTNSTVGAGLNLVTSCVAAGSALCNDRLGVARPSGNSAWDAGAYEFQATGAVTFPPSITSQPASQAVAVGQTATFTVVAAGTAPLAYQWTRNGTAISGATSSSYTTPSTATTDNGSQFGVVVSNLFGSASSSQAILTVNAGSGQLIASTSSLNFGNLGVAATNSMSATLTNTGSYAVHITGVSVSGAGFAISGVASGLTIEPGQAATLVVVFSPVAIGNATGSISVSSDAVNPAISISLQGTGTHSVALSWFPGDFSPVFYYNVYRASVSGGPYTLVNSFPVTTTQYVDTTVQSGQTYFYVVTTVNEDLIESAFSIEISVTIPNN